MSLFVALASPTATPTTHHPLALGVHREKYDRF